jgi:hypothetical protein
MMVMKKSVSPCPVALPDITTSCNAANALERLSLAEFRPAESAAKGGVDFVDDALLQALLDAVEYQRMHLLNVLGIVHSMSASFVERGDPAPEISAFALLEQEIQRVAAGLEEGALRNAIGPGSHSY